MWRRAARARVATYSQAEPALASDRRAAGRPIMALGYLRQGHLMSDSGSNGSEGDPVVRLTTPALAEIIELRAAEADPESLALCIEISGTAGDVYAYDMYFQAVADITESDWVDSREGLTVVVPGSSVDRLRGSVLDLDRDADGGGMVIRNPNRPPAGQRSPAMAG